MSDIKHMEVSTCQAAYNTLMNQHAELTAALQSITTSVTSMVGTAWIGTSATEFSARYDQLRLSMNQQLDQLLQLTNALQNEINEWQAADSGIGSAGV
ncbi:MAG TPA: WXG100 family type VII secretion target [Anaerolineaceae bacterium]|nr:WXG100 family type VII secretion target [Anaerolineaceae bacterium]HQF46782.1 WXG100 family type VII secretion target [Anaerolineaceae bacterium]